MQEPKRSTTESLKVQILSRKHIKPSNPTPQHLQKFKLSLLDQLAPPLYVHILFYYSLDEDCSRANNHHERCAQIEKSLSRVLTRFYPLAGRFVKDNLLIHCADQGVEYFEANVTAKLEDFIQKEPDADVLNRFLPWDLPPAPYLVTSPLLAIQINKFDCGGLVLGIRISHVIADAFSMMAFVKEWASICSNRLQETNGLSILPSFDQFVSLFPTRILSGTMLPPPAKNPTHHHLLTRAFLFDETIIAKMAEKAVSCGCSWQNFHPTRVVVVLALLWKALIGVSLSKHGQSRDSIVVLAMNLRNKTALAMSELCCRNFWIPVLVRLESKRADKIELEELMILLQDSVKSTSKNIATATAEDISTMLINSRREITEKRHLSGNSVDIYVCTSWCRLPIYEVDFGLGKPCWASHASKAFEGIALMDAKTGNGIEAWISLKDKEMIEFKQQLESPLLVVPK